jgi:palmitoyltransferase
MNESMKSDPTTQVTHEQATATNVSYTPPSEPMVFIDLHPQLQLTVTQAEIISAAQRGDINAIRELLESGKSKVTDRDDQNV